MEVESRSKVDNNEKKEDSGGQTLQGEPLRPGPASTPRAANRILPGVATHDDVFYGVRLEY